MFRGNCSQEAVAEARDEVVLQNVGVGVPHSGALRVPRPHRCLEPVGSQVGDGQLTGRRAGATFVLLAESAELGGDIGLRAADDLSTDPLAIGSATEVQLSDPTVPVLCVVDSAIISASPGHGDAFDASVPVISEPGRALNARDVEQVSGCPVVAVVDHTPSVGCIIDAGVFMHRQQRLREFTQLRNWLTPTTRTQETPCTPRC